MASKVDVIYFRLRARQWEYRNRVHATSQWLSLKLGSDCYVSWSAGKDSMVVAHLCTRLCPEIPILMVDPGVPIHWTQDDRARMLEFTEQQHWRLRIFPWDKFARARPELESDYRKSVHEDQFKDLTAHAESAGLSRRVTGIRCAESKARARVRAQTASTLQPLRDWSTEDVWTYTIEHGLPWLSIYDHLGPDARNGLIGKNGREHGRLVYLRRYYPEAFRRACELFGARDYV
jgi:3'-phosphoadenosine 5'-phosphosulfate sulfotransferase (PAPS reductase)/FAD synthetase